MVLIITSFALFSLHDAGFKLLVEDFSVAQILVVRSLVVVSACLAAPVLFGTPLVLRTPMMPQIVGRSLVLLAGWLLYYNAAQYLPLAELTILYYAAPLIVVVLSVFFLREQVSCRIWLAIFIGFAGVVLASGAATFSLSSGSMLALAAACLWATGTVLLRHLAQSQSTLTQMLVSNVIFGIGTLPFITFGWISPGLHQWLALFVLASLGGLAQLLLIESLRRAPASKIAPFEYTAILWAFMLQYLIWGDPPSAEALAGGLAVVVSALLAAGRRGPA